jgi:hypothetical protein
MVKNSGTSLSCQHSKKFKDWQIEVRNFLFYVDSRREYTRLELRLFKKGIDSIDAGEIILKA